MNIINAAHLTTAANMTLSTLPNFVLMKPACSAEVDVAGASAGAAAGADAGEAMAPLFGAGGFGAGWGGGVANAMCGWDAHEVEERT